MKKQMLGAVALTLAATAAHAQTNAGTFNAFVGLGITHGGEKLVTVTYTDGSSDTIRSGGFVELKAGAEYRFTTSPFSLQASVGYHADDTGASNGSVRFRRYPVEVLGYWHPNAQWRIGAGLRKANSAKITSSGEAASLGTIDFDSKVGGVVEAEYMFHPRFGLGIRGVSEKYEFTDGSGSFSGNHFGVRLNYYFL